MMNKIKSHIIKCLVTSFRDVIAGFCGRLRLLIKQLTTGCYGAYSQNAQQSNFRFKRHAHAAGNPRLLAPVVLLTVFSLLASVTVQATYMFPRNLVNGYVYARTLVLGENGQPILAEYDAQGELIRVIGEMTGTYENAQIMSADTFNQWLENFRHYRTQHEAGDARGAYLLTAEAYSTTTFVTVDGLPVERPALNSDTKSVYVRGDRALLTTVTNPVLFEAAINLIPYADTFQLADNIQSLVMSSTGVILEQSPYRIGLRAAFGKTDDDTLDCTEENALSTDKDNISLINTYDGEVPCGPVEGALIESLSSVTGDVFSATDETGSFNIAIINPSCPGFDFEYANDVWVTLYYSDFNPKRRGGVLSFSEFRRTYSYCIGSYLGLASSTNLSGQAAYIDALGAASTASVPVNRVRFPLEVVALTGVGSIRHIDGLPLTFGPLQHYVDVPVFTEQVPFSLDLDADGRVDQAVLYNGDVYVYLGGRAPEYDPNNSQQPINEDLKRVPDQIAAEGLPPYQGLVSQLSKEDLQDTDIYIYRVSNGRKIGEINGLKQNDFRDGILDQDGGWYYRALLPTGFNSDARRQSSWSSTVELEIARNEASADHITVGENLKLIAINRKTGYVGTQIVEITPAQNGSIQVQPDEIILLPPNLKITAERQYQVQAGLTQGEERNYIIGFEGSALTSDDFIAVTTEWFDHDGSPLPPDLPGYTGRLAKLVAENTLGASQVGHFEIKPGRNLQLVSLNGVDISKHHFYLHVAGEPKDENPDFSTLSNEPDFGSRPKYAVPFQVPIYNEADSNVEQLTYNQAQLEDPNTAIEEPVPNYFWVYRPEMQFSVFELSDVQFKYTDNDDTTKVIDLTSADPEDVFIPADQVDAIDVLYDLLFSDIAPLPQFDSDQQLVLTLGEEEVLVTIGEDQQVTFDNPDHLELLAGQDYVSLQLYANNDAANVLWEYAFGAPVIPSFDTKVFTVDDEQFDFAAFLPKQAGENPAEKITLRWSVSNGGRVENTVTSDTSTIHSNTVYLTTQANIDHYITVEVVESNNPSYIAGTQFRWGPYTVKAGQPHHVTLSSTEPELPADTRSQTQLEAEVFDQFNNHVEDGTPIYWFNEHTGEITQSDIQITSGKATATYTVDTSPQPSELFVQSGFVTESVTVTKAPLSLAISAPAIIDDVDLDVQQVSISVSGSDQLEGLPVYLESVMAEFVDSQVLLDSNGNATGYFYAPGIAGEDVIVASVAGVRQEIKVTYNKTGTYADLGNRTIVAGVADGTVSVETLDGSFNTHNYHTNTSLTIYGTPGEQYSLLPGGLYTPNSLPDLHFAMSELLGENDFGHNEIADSQNGVIAQLVGDVTMDFDNSYQEGGTSLLFNGGYLSLDVTNTPVAGATSFANVRFRYTGDANQVTLLRKGSAVDPVYALQLVKDTGEYYFEAVVKTQSGQQIVRATTPVVVDDWYIAGFKLRDGNIILGLDGEQTSVPLQDTLVDSAEGLVAGESFAGNIDDIKIGNENAGDEIIELADAQLTIGADGSATTTIQSTGVEPGFGQRVGFSVALVTGSTAKLDYQELRFAPDRDNDATLRNRSQLARVLGIRDAYADCKTRGCLKNRNHEQGVAVAGQGLWASVIEWVVKDAISTLIDATKAAGSFLYTLTAFHDVEVLVKAFLSLIDNDPTTNPNGFDTTFAVISLGITVFALVTTGPGAIAAAAGLKSLKPIIRFIWVELGPGALLDLGVIIVKGFVRAMKGLVSGGFAVTGKLLRIGQSLLVVLDGSIVGVRDLFFNIRSARQFDDFVELFHDASNLPCLVGVTANVQTMTVVDAYALPLNLRLNYFAEPAYAQGCKNIATEIAGAATNAARFGDEAKDVSRATMELWSILTKQGIDIAQLSEEGLEGVFWYVYHFRKVSQADGVDRASRIFNAIDFDEVDDAFAAISLIKSQANAVPEAGLLRVFRELGTPVKAGDDVEEITNKMIGTLHTLRDLGAQLAGKNIDEVVEFEKAITKNELEPWGHGRSIDAVVKEGGNLKNIEYKGSKSDTGFGLTKESLQNEFLTDVVIFAKSGTEFKWVLEVPPLQVESFKSTMLKLLGDSGEMSPKLVAYIEKVRKVDPDQADLIEVAVGRLISDIKQGKVVFSNAY